MTNQKQKTPKGTKPLYVIRIGEKGGSPGTGYYKAESAWKEVERSEASRLTHKKAQAVRGHLKRLGYSAVVEPVERQDK